MKYILYPLLLFIMPCVAFTQDISGLWKGTLLNDSTQESLDYEIVINKEKGRYTGFSHTWFIVNDQKYYGIKKVKVHIAKDGKVIIQDAELIDNNYPVSPDKNIRQLNVLDLKAGAETMLDGVFVTNETKHKRELTGRVSVKKVNSFTQSDLLQYLEKENIDNSLTIMKSFNSF